VTENVREPDGNAGNGASDTGHYLVLEIEIPDFYVDGTTQEAADEWGCEIVDIVTEEWMRRDVGLTLVSIPGEKEMNSDFEVHAMNGRIVGARIETLQTDRYQDGGSPHNKERPRDVGAPGAAT
jgi:hypothetical protein